MDKRSEIRRLSDDELLQVVHSNGGLFFGPPDSEYKELAMKELVHRGFDEDKFKYETGMLKKRAEVPLEKSILITNILLPSNEFFKYDVDRFRKYGFEKKVRQDLISRFFGFVFYGVIVVGFVIYLLIRNM